jgi:S-adenosylmethionine:tRNA ribosyltransferase-isomerase
VRPGRRIREGQQLLFERAGSGAPDKPALSASVVARTEAGGRILRFAPPASGEPLDAVLAQLGTMPLPPYIHTQLENAERYQTVYSREPGSAAAPTAGLHFTPELLARLAAQGVETAYVLLHVGLDTFRPVEEEDPSDHKMHSEAFELDERAAAQINAARARGGRIIAVGTTSVRVLESLPSRSQVTPCQGRTTLFITPGYKFRYADALITNFHLPRSSLMMLVSAFAGTNKSAPFTEGIDLIRRAYAEAIAQRYRFFSFGDAMLLL